MKAAKPEAGNFVYFFAFAAAGALLLAWASSQNFGATFSLEKNPAGASSASAAGVSALDAPPSSVAASEPDASTSSPQPPAFPRECLDFFEEHHEAAKGLEDHHSHDSPPPGCRELLPRKIPEEEASCFFTHAKINSLKPRAYGEECVSHGDCPGSLEFTVLAHHGECPAGTGFHCTIRCEDDAFCRKQTGGVLGECCRECAGAFAKEIGFCVK